MISSRDNPRVKQIRALLADRGERRRQSLFVLEGVRLLRDALDAGVTPRLVLYAAALVERSGGRDLLGRIAREALWEVTPQVLKAVADTVTPQGIVAAVPLPAPAAPSGRLVLVLDRLRDPGNLGTILRTAPAAGVQTVLLTRGSVDPFNPKVVRAAMGGHFRVGLGWDLDWPALRNRLAGRALRLAVPRGGRSVWEVDWHEETALVLGGETEGPDGAVADAERITVPMAGDTESLNAAVAAAVILFVAQKQAEDSY